MPPDSGLSRWTEWAGFSFPLNLSQQPAVSVPCGVTASGLPVGLQLVSGQGQDGRLLAFAEAFEQSLPENAL